MGSDPSKQFWLYSPQKRRAYKVELRIRGQVPLDVSIYDIVDPKFWEDHPDHMPLFLSKSVNELPKQGTAIALVGWPQFHPSHSISVKHGTISSTLTKSTITYCETTAQIIQGNSGGPLLDSNNNVIGIASSGNNRENPEEVTMHTAILSQNFLALLKQHNN